MRTGRLWVFCQNNQLVLRNTENGLVHIDHTEYANHCRNADADQTAQAHNLCLGNG